MTVALGHGALSCWKQQLEDGYIVAMTGCTWSATILKCGEQNANSLIAQSGYPSYHSLSGSSNHSGHSPLTLSTAAHCFFFFFLPRSAVTEMLKPACLAPTITPRLKSLRSHFPPFWWLMWTLTEAPDSICMILCTAATRFGWLDYHMNKQVYRCFSKCSVSV